MNPLVEKMLIAQREGIDARTLEQIFEHEAKCEDYHRYVKSCSHAGVYHVQDCHESYVTCSNSVILPGGIFNRMYRGDDCEGCGNSAVKCWTIRPI